jgi:pyruvate dehydrogenase (quinone)
MFADVAGFVQEASSPAQVRHLLHRSLRVAKANNAPSILPKDVQDEEYGEPAVVHGFTRSGIGYSRPKIVPEDADLMKAAEILNAGKRVDMLVGAGGRGTASPLIEMATLLGAGVAKALLGKDVLPVSSASATRCIVLIDGLALPFSMRDKRDSAHSARSATFFNVNKYTIDLILVWWNFRNVTLHSLLSLQRPF